MRVVAFNNISIIKCLTTIKSASSHRVY